MNSKNIKYGVAIVGVLLLLLIIFTVPFGIAYVEWNEYALKKNSITNKVDYTQVFENGRHYFGVGKKAVKFTNTANNIEFWNPNGLVTFTDNGLEIDIDCSFQYKIRKELLPELFKT